MELYKIEYDINGNPVSVRFYVDNKEIVFQKICTIKNGHPIIKVIKVEVILYGKKIFESDKDFWIPEKIFQTLKKRAFDILVEVKEKRFEGACPKCDFVDPFLLELNDAGRFSEIKGRAHTCPNCGNTFVIPDDRPLYWGHSVKKKKKRIRKKK